MESKGNERALIRLTLGKRFLIPLVVFIASTGIAGLAFTLSSTLTPSAFVDERLYLFGTLPSSSWISRSHSCCSVPDGPGWGEKATAGLVWQ
jgi:hypothetical protein